MSLHRSLKTKPSGLNQHRNVLTRNERIEHLAERGEFELDGDSPFGLVKVGNRKVQAKKKVKEDVRRGWHCHAAEGAEAASSEES